MDSGAWLPINKKAPLELLAQQQEQAALSRRAIEDMKTKNRLER